MHAKNIFDTLGLHTSIKLIIISLFIPWGKHYSLITLVFQTSTHSGLSPLQFHMDPKLSLSLFFSLSLSFSLVIFFLPGFMTPNPLIPPFPFDGSLSLFLSLTLSFSHSCTCFLMTAGIWVLCLLFHLLCRCCCLVSFSYSSTSSSSSSSSFLPPPLPPPLPRKSADLNVRVCSEVFFFYFIFTLVQMHTDNALNSSSTCCPCCSPAIFAWSSFPNSPSHLRTLGSLGPSKTTGLPGTGVLYAGRDRGLPCQSPGQAPGVSWTSSGFRF